jgi:hypothetical protein
VLTTDQKGAIAESAIAHTAIKLGVGVYRPLMEGGRYDLILEVGSALVRTQCKWAPMHGDVIVVRCYSNRRAREGLRRRCYTGAEVDCIAAYCPDLDRSYLLPSARFDSRQQIHLRVGAARNNQRVGVTWAEDFAFEARLTDLLGP